MQDQIEVYVFVHVWNLAKLNPWLKIINPPDGYVTLEIFGKGIIASNS